MIRTLRGKITAFLLAQAALWQTGCQEQPQSRGHEDLPAARVRVQTVEAVRHVATEEVVGTVRAKLHAALEAKVSGRLESMLVTPGQTVKAGELLAQLDATSYRYFSAVGAGGGTGAPARGGAANHSADRGRARLHAWVRREGG